MDSWVLYDNSCDFTIYNFPLGVAWYKEKYSVVSAIGDFVIDLDYLQQNGYLDPISLPKGIFSNQFINDFIGLGNETTKQVRERLIFLFDSKTAPKDFILRKDFYLIPISDVSLTLPLNIGDYTDFYSSREHATNVGIMFRDPANALLPNWLHLPVAYHGRSSSIQVSGHDIIRPNGQLKSDADPNPTYGQSKLVDFELEMAVVVSKNSTIGQQISTGDAGNYIYGMALFNDWSARDIQKWEYVPLGPFLSKNFASTLSPWIVSLEALKPFKVNGPESEKPLLPYLHYEGAQNYDIQLDVEIVSSTGANAVVSKSNHKYLYWNILQQLAHHTVNGCNIRVGDIYASGTISGPDSESFGSMLEISWQGTKPIKLSDGSERKFIQDGDTVIIRGFAQKNEIRVGFGEARATVISIK
ncbi:MAG: fumarylacetoacetase [Saprospiraceae bacterium]|nr:fumarylacetoacetase [Saprospiraceae bacterium]